MKINTDELTSIVEYCFKNYLKQYSIYLSHLSIEIDDKINLNAVIEYNQKKIKMNLTFLLNYKNNQLIIDRIEGQVYYIIYKIPYMTILKQFNKYSYIHILDNKIIIDCKLPIESIYMIKRHLVIKIQHLKS